jgi:DNA-binding transcriptional ArsR family regulator
MRVQPLPGVSQATTLNSSASASIWLPTSSGRRPRRSRRLRPWTLQILRPAGLVSARKDGTKVYYRLAGSDGAALRDVASTRLATVDRVRGAYLGRVAYVCHYAGLVGRQSVGVATAHYR